MQYQRIVRIRRRLVRWRYLYDQERPRVWKDRTLFTGGVGAAIDGTLISPAYFVGLGSRCRLAIRAGTQGAKESLDEHFDLLLRFIKRNQSQEFEEPRNKPSDARERKDHVSFYLCHASLRNLVLQADSAAHS